MSSKPAAAADAKGQNEPSMEEILASIRRIIADDTIGTKKDEPAPPAPVVKAPEPEPEPDDEDSDVLDLAAVATVTMPEPVMAEMPVSFEPVDVMVDDPEPEPEPMMPSFAMPVSPLVPPAPPVRNVVELEDRILSQETGSLVSDAFQTLARNSAMPAVGRSIEDVVVELLRPMMRQWLDNHLPGIVERLVKTEIERVARGG